MTWRGGDDVSLGLRFCAKTILDRLRAIRSEVPGVRSGEDIEHLHRMRVASRRARVALRMFGPSLGLPDERRSGLKGVTKELGRARDLDVQGEWLEAFCPGLDRRARPGAQRFLLRIRQRRQREQRRILQLLDWLEGPSGLAPLEEALAALALGPDGSVSALALMGASVMGLSLRVRDLGAYMDTQDHQAHHRMRIAVKSLRYALEICQPAAGDQVKPLLEGLKALQGALGREHDGLVWGQMADRYLEREREMTLSYFGHLRPLKRLVPGFRAVKDDRLRDAAEGLALAREIWDRMARDGFVDRIQDLASKMAGGGD